MKVLLGFFNSESNEHSVKKMSKDRFIYKFGQELIDDMYVEEVFKKENIELIPSIYANGFPSGPVTLDAYEYIEEELLGTIKKHLHEIDGIFLYLHGASKVIGLQGDSAEHSFIKKIREITGPYLPIGVVMDPHGNLSQEYVDQVNVLRCYRESPHTDIEETFIKTAEIFADLLKNRRIIKPVYRKIPIIIGGERSVSTDEPVASFNKMLDEFEKDPRILSASFHVGYLRHDGDKLGCSVVVVPNTPEDTLYAEKVADNMTRYIIDRRHDFHFHGNYGEPEEALQLAVESNKKSYITDSGDNCGAGSDGYSNYIFRQILELDDFNDKNYLIAGVVDEDAALYLRNKKEGDEVDFFFGKNIDDNSLPVKITGKVVAIGNVYLDLGEKGRAVTVKMDNYPISITVLEESMSYTENIQFEWSNIDIEEYDVVVVKQGYISPDFKESGAFTIMSLTQGPTYQRSENYKYKRIMRPMFPYDEID